MHYAKYVFFPMIKIEQFIDCLRLVLEEYNRAT